MRLRAQLVVCGLIILEMGGPAIAGADGDERPWRVTASALAYVVPDEPDFVMVIVPVDIRRVHVEARYDYEARHSGSAFVGVSAGWGETLKLKVTPMIGAVVGDLDGLVPALRWTLAWWKLDLYSESEVVIDYADTSASFFYNWSELGLSPLAWLRFGAALQRNRIFHTPLDIQRGLFAGVTVRFVTVTLYEFNAGWTTPTWVAGLSVSF